MKFGLYSSIANPPRGEHLERSYSEQTGRRLGIDIDYFPTRNQDELTAALNVMSGKPPQAISLFADGFAIQNRQRIIEFATSHRAAVISGWPVFAKSGALCTYGPRLAESYRRLAHYVDRVLKGAKPADLPVEQPTSFDLVINQTAVERLGLTIPQDVSLQVTEWVQ